MGKYKKDEEGDKVLMGDWINEGRSPERREAETGQTDIEACLQRGDPIAKALFAERHTGQPNGRRPKVLIIWAASVYKSNDRENALPPVPKGI
jgi:hypothetical protein